MRWFVWAVLLGCKGVVVTAFPDKFVGVGLELTIRDNAPTVIRALDGGSAQEAGMLSEDHIVAINDEPTEGLALPDIVLRLRGESGTTVNLTVVCAGQPLRVALVRHDIAKRGDDYVARH